MPFQRHKRSTSLYTDSDCLYTDHEWFDVVCRKFLWLRARCVGDFVDGRGPGGGKSAIAVGNFNFFGIRAFQS